MDSCIEWPKYRNALGYGVRRYHGKLWLAHRVAWTEANGAIPTGLCVLHKCDNPPCINPEHLFLGTNLDNARDMVRKGRQANVRGERNPKAKLTEHQVKVIRGCRRMGCSLKYLANRYGVTMANISDIGNGDTWNHC